MKDYYDILGIRRDASATEIKKAYRRRAMKFARTGMDEVDIASKLARAGCPRELAIAVARQAKEETGAEKPDDGANSSEEKSESTSKTQRREHQLAASHATEKRKRGIDYKPPSLAIVYLLALLAIAALVTFGPLIMPGNTPSSIFYGGMKYYLGNDLSSLDLKLARIYFERAADKGHVQAKTYLGYMLENGIGGPKDAERGWELLLEASEGRDRIAQGLVAETYVKFSGADLLSKGIALMEKSAATGVITSQRWLCDYYTFFGKEESDFITAHFFCLETARNDETIPGWIDSALLIKNRAEASATLAHQYYFGEGVHADEETAVSWADAAIEGGAPLGYWIKALAYQAGKGVERDFAVARSNLSMAAEAGLSLAQEYYAGYLAGGIGGERDLKSAMEWYRKAAVQGEPSAQISLAELLLQDSQSEKGVAESLAWILIAEQSEKSDKEKIKKVKQQIQLISEEQASRATEMAKDGKTTMAQ